MVIEMKPGEPKTISVLKIRRRVDLRGRMVALECALERGAASYGAAGVGLLDGAAVVHETVVLLLVLLAAPDAPGDQRQAAEDDGAADTDDHADDRVARLRRHARRLTAVAVGEPWRGGREGRLAGHRFGGAIVASGRPDDGGCRGWLHTFRGRRRRGRVGR